jgi:ankyrin repeat protein
MARRLLEAHADPNAPSGCMTPLLVATMTGNNEIVELLLEYNADPDLRHWGHTPRGNCESNQELKKILLRHAIKKSMREKSKA